MIKSKKSILKVIIVPLLLLGIALVLTGYTSMTFNASLTVLPVRHSTDVSLTPEYGKLYKGQTIRGSFVASENNLGTVDIKLHNFHVPNELGARKIVVEDTILFKIKQQGMKEWYYQNQYSGGQFHELEYFPFGFPIINDSKNKKYQFEVTSLNGDETNYLTLSEGNPKLGATYQFDKSQLIKDRQYLLSFLIKKQLYAITILDYFFILFVYLLPFILYILWLLPIGRKVDNLSIIFYKNIKNRFGPKAQGVAKKLSTNVTIYELLILSGLAVDILLIHEVNHIVTILLLSLWIIRIIIGKFTSDVTFFIALLLLIFSSFLLLFKQPIAAEKTAYWVFFFLLIGVFQSLYEMKRVKNE